MNYSYVLIQAGAGESGTCFFKERIVLIGGIDGKTKISYRCIQEFK